MKTIGIIGGMSWESSAEYYRLINAQVRDRLGAAHSASSLMLSLDFQRIADLQRAGDWDTLTAEMIAAARALERGGAGCVVIATNTMHLMADAVAASVSIPLLHIADAAGTAIRAAGHARIGLLGTVFTMEQPFYAERLARWGVDAIVPPADDRATVNAINYDQLVRGRILPASRAAYAQVIARLVARGADAVLLGCTEIMLLVRPEDSPVPLFDTTALHAAAAVEWALAG